MVGALAANAERNGVEVLFPKRWRAEGARRSRHQPAAHTLALARAAGRHGAELRTGFRATAIRRDQGDFVLESAAGESVRSRLVVNCAGLHVDTIARLAGDHSFEIYPRKGEFLVFDPPRGERLERILLPEPTARTKGVLVFPAVDGKVIAGPTAVDQVDKDDWSVRPEAREEIHPAAVAMWPPLEGASRSPPTRGCDRRGAVDYLIEPSRACAGLVNVAAIRSTGLTASLGIAEYVCVLVEGLGVTLRREQPLEPGAPVQTEVPWWRRAAEYRSR